MKDVTVRVRVGEVDAETARRLAEETRLHLPPDRESPDAALWALYGLRVERASR
jgi:hypothetical protein